MEKENKRWPKHSFPSWLSITEKSGTGEGFGAEHTISSYRFCTLEGSRDFRVVVGYI